MHLEKKKKIYLYLLFLNWNTIPFLIRNQLISSLQKNTIVRYEIINIQVLIQYFSIYPSIYNKIYSVYKKRCMVPSCITLHFLNNPSKSSSHTKRVHFLKLDQKAKPFYFFILSWLHPFVLRTLCAVSKKVSIKQVSIKSPNFDRNFVPLRTTL